MATQDMFVLDPHYADWVWNYIRSRARVYWPDDKRLNYITEVTPETKTWYRDGSWDKTDNAEWFRKGEIGMPDFPGFPGMDFRKGSVRSARLAGVSYTVVGSWYTFEAVNDAGDPAVFDPIRLPVTDGMVEEAKDWSRSYGGEFLRRKGVEFNERFATALDGEEASRAASELSDVHVRIPEVTTEQEAKDVLREATDMAERAVRQVM